MKQDRARAGARWRTYVPLRVQPHRDSSAALAGAYPFLAAPPPGVGMPVGVDGLTGQAFCFDPWELYGAGVLTNPNVVLAGVIGQGKSALAKSLAVRAVAAGRRVYVPGDPKGEWTPVTERVGGQVIRLGAGLGSRLNPLQMHGETATVEQGVQLVVALAEATLGRGLLPAEHTALDAALLTVLQTPVPVVVPSVLDALAHPEKDQARRDGTTAAERAADGRDVAHGLRRLVRGDLAGLFDGPSTVELDPAAPMVSLDLSGLGSHETALSIAMTCTATWLEGALRASPGRRWVIYDEAWRVLHQLPLARRMQAQWKLSRAYGIANLMVLHRLSDLDAAGAGGSQARAVAEGLLADCSTRVVYRTETDQVPATTAALGLTDPESLLLPRLPRGSGLWTMPTGSWVVHHRLHAAEAELFDTDAAMRPGAGS